MWVKSLTKSIGIAIIGILLALLGIITMIIFHNNYDIPKCSKDIILLPEANIVFIGMFILLTLIQWPVFYSEMKDAEKEELYEMLNSIGK